MMKKLFILCLCGMLFLTGCGRGETPAEGTSQPETPASEETLKPVETQKPEETSKPEETPAAEELPEPFVIREVLVLPAAAEKADISNAIGQAIEGMHAGFSMDVSQISFEQGVDLDVLNLYYRVMADRPELKHAYSIISELTDGVLNCTFSYMPYKTGEFPEDFEGEEIASLKELLAVAEENLDKDMVNIRITNPDLNIEEMQQVLRQAGKGYFFCMLYADATAIMISYPEQEYTREEILTQLAEIDEMADEIIKQRVTEGMTEREKALALYSYVTENVRYDQRYYTDRKNMPFESMTAYGAFYDGMAICGGYSYAVHTLFEKAGITCYEVSGVWGSETHMWNVALLDGEWLYFDATADRGMTENFRSFAVTAEELTNHTWNMEYIEPLLNN